MIKGIKMDKISELLNEAKPLYFERKRRNKAIKNSLFLILPILVVSLSVLPFISNNDSTDYYTSSISIVEQMGFPTDDYGLLKVD